MNVDRQRDSVSRASWEGGPHPLVATLSAAMGSPFFPGNRIEGLRNGREIFPAMLEAIGQASRSVDFLTYVYWSGTIALRFAEALSEAAQRGVQVRVLLDGVGAFPIDRGLLSRMRDAGVDARWFRPVSRWRRFWNVTHRTHRKVLVCDDRLGFTGGVGIGEEWEGDARDPSEWRETHFQVQGPAVSGLKAAFLENWLEAAEGDCSLGVGQIPTSHQGEAQILVVRSSAAARWSDLSTLFQFLFEGAQRSVRISTPYFVPDEAMTSRLVDVAERGLRVELLLPGPHIDLRVSRVAAETFYERLLDAGVGILEYQPTMIHQKVTIVDSHLVALGSANLNHRSLLQDDEVQLIVADDGFAAQMDAMLDDDAAASRPVSHGDWKKRGWLRRSVAAITRPFHRQM